MNKAQYPKFIWVIGGIILLIAITYTIFLRQNISKIVFPGGEVQFKSSNTKDNPISFSVYYDLTDDGYDRFVGIRVNTNIYINDKLAATLSTKQQENHFAMAHITVPRPGTYRYRLEQGILWGDNKRSIRGLGKITVKEGDAFIVETKHEIGNLDWHRHKESVTLRRAD